MNKFTQKLAGMSLATVLAFGGIVNTAHAAGAEGYDVSQITGITKQVQVREGLAVPTETFTFNIEALGNEDVLPTGYIAVDSNSTLVTFDDDTKTRTLSFSEGDKDASGVTATKRLGLKFDVSQVDKAGRYRFKITETEGSRAGMQYDTAKYVDLRITRNANNELEISNVVISDGRTEEVDGRIVPVTEGKADTSTRLKNPQETPVTENPAPNLDGLSATDVAISFVNRYGVNEDGTDISTPDPSEPGSETNNPNPNPETGKDNLDPNTIYKVQVGKTISADSSIIDSNEEFEFTVTIKGDEGDVFTYNNSNYTADEQGLATITLNLKDGERAIIDGLTSKDEITVKETDAKGYTPTGEINSVQLNQIDGLTTIVTNTSNEEIPTGLIQNIVPFAIILVVAGGAAYLYIKKQNEKQLA